MRLPIHSIAETWGDKEAVAQARQRLQAALSAPKVVKKQKDFEFVIDNRNTYTLLNDFKSPEARNKMAAWQKSRTQLDKSRQQLQNLRDRYATGNDAQRQTLSQQILQLEAQCEKPKPHCMRKPKPSAIWRYNPARNNHVYLLNHNAYEQVFAPSELIINEDGSISIST